MAKKMLPLSEWLIEDATVTGKSKARDTAIRWLRAGHLKGKIFYRCINLIGGIPCNREYSVVDYFKDRCPKCGSYKKTGRGKWFVLTPPGERESEPPPAGRRW